MTNAIIAALDGSGFSTPVLKLTAWAAIRNNAPVRLLHVLAAKEPPKPDLSGALRLGARSSLLAELSELDAKRARIANAQGRALLDDATQFLRGEGVSSVAAHLRQGDLLDSVAAVGADANLIVIGKRGATADRAHGHLGSNFERIVRGTDLAVLMAPFAPREISRVVIAYDGSASAQRAVARVARLPAYRNLTLEVVTVAAGTEAASRIADAQAVLAAAGLSAGSTILDGPADEAILAHLERSDADCLVMGAYGHSRIRSLMVGSTTTSLLQRAQVPVLLVR